MFATEFVKEKVYVLGIQGRTLSDVLAVFKTKEAAERAKKEMRKDATGASRDDFYIAEKLFFKEIE